MLENIPAEMKMYAQWIVWRYEDLNAAKPVKVPYCARTGFKASVTDPGTWSNFDTAVNAVNSGQFSGLGFVLAESDPFAFIDLDDPWEMNPAGGYVHKNPDDVMSRQMHIFNEFQSYAERSPSGKGLHIIVKGALPSGRRRSSIEIYTSERYMTMTGNVYRPGNIVEYNDLLNALWAQMSKGQSNTAYYSGLEEPTETDQEVIARAGAASNGEKFMQLMCGEWQNIYSSQSEADFALIDIIAFYSHNKPQIVRIFKMSVLAQRNKAQRTGYIGYMLAKCFDRMLPPVDVEGLRNQLDEALAARVRESAQVQTTEPVPTAAPSGAPLNSIYTAPPGLVGQLAHYIYSSSARPVPEIALISALSIMAGVAGRAYNISGTGLNQYFMLLATTGTGKEALRGGIDKLFGAIAQTVPASGSFVGPGTIASPQALIKYLASESRCFITVFGEFGKLLRRMSSPYAPTCDTGLLALFLDLFNKSGNGDILRPSIYSDKDKSTGNVKSPAFSMLGECTPESFYESLHEGMISDGFVPRLTVVEYLGDRPHLNEGHMWVKPSFELVDQFGGFVAQCLMLNSQDKSVNVEYTPEAQQLLRDFNLHCDNKIRNGKHEVSKQLWNRAHLKALKLSGLVAVGCNSTNPVITVNDATWAINIIIAGVDNLLRRFDAGEIGVDNDEMQQLTKVVAMMHDYLVQPWSEVKRYCSDNMAKLHGDRIVPYAYIQRRLGNVAVFKRGHGGAAEVIKRALNVLAERGDIVMVGKPKLATDYGGVNCLAYAIVNPKIFE